MALFAQSAQSSSRGSTNGHKHSIEIKAGRMYLVSSEQEAAKKKIVHPDLRWVQDDDCQVEDQVRMMVQIFLLLISIYFLLDKDLFIYTQTMTGKNSWYHHVILTDLQLLSGWLTSVGRKDLQEMLKKTWSSSPTNASLNELINARMVELFSCNGSWRPAKCSSGCKSL